MSKRSRAAALALFVIYCAVMLWLLFARSESSIRGVSLVPFATIKEFWTAMLQSYGNEGMETLFMLSFVNLAGNVVMFIPLGFFLPLLWRGLRRYWLSLPVCAALIVAVEALQFMTGLGSADIDDFILNMLGAVLGYAFFAAAGKIEARKNTAIFIERNGQIW